MIGLAKVGITETVLRDAHQSLIATRMTTEEMLPVLEQLDDIGFRSLECWGGATFDSCLRFLGEDPWERLRTLKKHMPKTPLQMLFRGQNMLATGITPTMLWNISCRNLWPTVSTSSGFSTRSMISGTSRPPSRPPKRNGRPCPGRDVLHHQPGP